MNRVLSFVFAVVFVVTLAGCQGPIARLRHRGGSPSETAVAYNSQSEHVSTVSSSSSGGGGGSVTLLNDGTFDSEITNSQGVAIVDFFAQWCGPCKKMSPVLDAMAAETSDARIAKVNVDASEETAGKFDVHAMPCLVVFKDGKEVERHYGVHSKDEIRGWIQAYSEKSVSLAK